MFIIHTEVLVVVYVVIPFRLAERIGKNWQWDLGSIVGRLDAPSVTTERSGEAVFKTI